MKPIYAEGLHPSSQIIASIDRFTTIYTILEYKLGNKPILLLDERSGAYYLTCHILGTQLAKDADLKAAIAEDEDGEIYKLNRDIVVDNSAFRTMKEDATGGRIFEDLVIEYDESYSKLTPLKVYGGQHRINAIKEAESKYDNYHGIRVYFGLSSEQKVEIAIVNNTSISVPSDLLDRMREQLIGSDLRNWCQEVGLLEIGEDFSDRKSPTKPTVRVVRTLLTNYYKGKSKSFSDLFEPVVCSTGGIDSEFEEIRSKINWKDSNLVRLGKEYAKLNKLQRDRITNRSEGSRNAEFARKALSLCVVAAWGYATGVLETDPDRLDKHFNLIDVVSSNEDPLNTEVLSKAKIKGVDPENYRGLGTRSDSKELGRMLELFLIRSEKGLKINKELTQAAMKTYAAKKATREANLAIKRL